jgi:hypothetical protein
VKPFWPLLRYTQKFAFGYKELFATQKVAQRLKVEQAQR